MLLRTFARLDKLAWDMDARTVDLTITSVQKAGRHFDCPAWHRSDFRLVRSFGGEAAVRQGRLRPALAGRKTGGGSFEARTAQPAGLGQLGRLMLVEQQTREEIMKRRDFLKTSAAAAGLVGSLKIAPMLAAAESDPQTSTGAPPTDNRPAEYLHRVQGDPFLPKPPAPARSYPISPMPLAERVRRKIVPQRGFCSIAPGDLVSESLTSGNGAMNIELMGDPYAEQILFHHESLLMPWKRPVEAPKVADIFPQVRQMVLDGKDREAMTLALQRMNDRPDQAGHRAAPHHPGVPDAARFSENRVGQGLSPHRRFRERAR